VVIITFNMLGSMAQIVVMVALMMVSVIKAQVPAACFTDTGCTWDDISPYSSEDLSGATVTFGTDTGKTIIVPNTITFLKSIIVNGANTLSVSSNLTLVSTLTVEQEATLTVTSPNGKLYVGAGANVAGSVTVTGDIIGTGDGVYSQSSGTLTLRPPGSVIFSSAKFAQAATLTGVGAIGTNLEIDGSLRVGNGIIRIPGSYNPSPTSTFYFRANNATAFTRLQVRAANLNGKVLCTFVGGYRPAAEESYALVYGSGVQGAFISIVGEGDDATKWTGQIATNFASVTWGMLNATSTGPVDSTTSSSASSLSCFSVVVLSFLFVSTMMMI